MILAWVGVVAIFAKNSNGKMTQLVDGVEEVHYKWFFAFMVFLPVILIAAFRDTGFLNNFDTGMYTNTFNNAPNDFSGFFDYINSQEKDTGFYVFYSLIKIIITKDVVVCYFLIALLQGCIILSVYRYYSKDFIFSFFLFVASADYISWMCNGIRQSLAVLIIFSATPLLLRKKYVPLIAIILFASTFHRSALIMIPIVFIVQGKAWNAKTLIVVFLVIVAIFFAGRFSGFLDSSLQGTQYTNVVSDYTESGDDGTNPLRVLVYSIPTIIAIFGRNKLKTDNPLLNICINMSIISTGLYVISMFTSGIFLGRLPIYCSLYNYILLPWEIKLIFEEDMQKTISLSAVALYLVYYVYQTHFIWRLY